MTTPYLADLLLAERADQLRRDAAGARLAALARCCRPSSWRWAATRTRAVLALLRHDRPTATGCCPA